MNELSTENRPPFALSNLIFGALSYRKEHRPFVQQLTPKSDIYYLAKFRLPFIF